LKSQN